MNLNKEFKKIEKNYKNSLNNYRKKYIMVLIKSQEKVIDKIRQKISKCSKFNSLIKQKNSMFRLECNEKIW